MWIWVASSDLSIELGRKWHQLLQSKFKKHDSVIAVIVIKVLVRTESLTLLKKNYVLCFLKFK